MAHQRSAEYDCGNRHYRRGGWMQVRDGMSATVLTVGPGHTLREAAKLMARRKVGAAIVLDPDVEKVGDHLSATLTFAAPDWSLERAAEAMVRGGFRHLVVVDGGETVGVLSMRDIVRVWTDDGASCEVDDKLSAA
jgi:CBS domain-containing protein